MPRKASRRMFLAATAAAATGFAHFSPNEANLVAALCEQFLPSDDLPGAKEAGVANYIDRQLSGPLRRFAGAYRTGLKGLEAAGFLAMSVDDRTRLLEQAEAGKLSGVTPSFIRMAADHTMQGFFGDPKHGGNKDRVSWKMLGIADGGHSH